MESNNNTLNDERRADNATKNHSHTRDYQALDEILPMALVILKSQIRKSYLPEESNKFYSPIWVATLLERLSTDEHPLNDEEYQTFRTNVEKLSVNDYKTADDDFLAIFRSSLL